MAQPIDLQDGDYLLFTADSLLDDAIEIGEDDGASKFTQFIHAARVLDVANDQGYQMVAPKSEYMSLKALPWDHIKVYRPMVAFDISVMRAWCAKDVGTPYPAAEDVKFLVADLLKKQGLGSVSQWVDAFASSEDPRLMVCSASCAAMGTADSGGKMDWPRTDTNMRPCDLPLGQIELVILVPPGMA